MTTRNSFAYPKVDVPKIPRWPYPWWYYPLRFFWQIIWASVWKVAWHRLYFLRAATLKAFGTRTSLKVGVCGSTWIEIPWHLSLGIWSSLGPRVHVYNPGQVTIGERTIVSQDVYICAGTHDYTRHTYPLIRSPVTIGNDVWIAAGAFIGPGIRIGDGAVIGARSVVVADVDPWTVVGGNPARPIKKRILSDD